MLVFVYVVFGCVLVWWARVQLLAVRFSGSTYLALRSAALLVDSSGGPLVSQRVDCAGVGCWLLWLLEATATSSPGAGSSRAREPHLPQHIIGVLLKVFVRAPVAGTRLFNGAHVARKILGFTVFNHGYFYKRPRQIFLIGIY